PICANTSVTVGDTNSIPIATPMKVVAATSPAFIELSGTDEDLDPLSYQIRSLPAAGALLDAADDRPIEPGDLPYNLPEGGRTVKYVPPAGFAGAESFRFAVHDGSVAGPPSTVVVSVPKGPSGPSYRTTIPPVTPQRFTLVE